jgi:hypothetical protein
MQIKDLLPAFRKLTASMRVRINEGLTICVSSHTFCLKFLIKIQFSAAEVETLTG